LWGESACFAHDDSGVERGSAAEAAVPHLDALRGAEALLFHGAARVGARFWRTEVRIKNEIKIKINVKSSGQECPLHTSNLDWPREQIDEAIRRYERLLLILSPNSMSSKWVKTEIRNARKREVAEKKRVLFPVRLDAV
jgi:hypothetical protein